MAKSRPVAFNRRGMDLSWLKSELQKPGRSQSALARYMGLEHPSIVNRIVKGERQLKLHEAEKIREYLQVTGNGGDMPFGEQPSLSRMVPVVGAVEAGAWREIANDDMPSDTVPIVETSALQGEVFALRVAGPSMNKYYADGSFVLVRPWHGGPLPIGKRIVVRRIRPDGLYESTVKELVRNSHGELELWPRSHDPRHQSAVPYEAPGVTVEIVGRVIGSLNLEE